MVLGDCPHFADLAQQDRNMSKRKRSAPPPVERIEPRSGGRAQKTIDTGVTQRLISGTLRDGKFEAELSCGGLFFCIGGEPIFATYVENVLHRLRAEADLPNDVLN